MAGGTAMREGIGARVDHGTGTNANGRETTDFDRARNGRPSDAEDRECSRSRKRASTNGSVIGKVQAERSSHPDRSPIPRHPQTALEDGESRFTGPFGGGPDRDRKAPDRIGREIGQEDVARLEPREVAGP